METLFTVLLLVTATVIISALISRLLSGVFTLSQPLLALTFGILCGPRVIGILNPSLWPQSDTILEEATRITLGFAEMAVALRIPPSFYKKYWKATLFVIGVVMPLMWVASGLVLYLFISVPFWVAMLAGAIVTPTDPVVASSIVTGNHAENNIPDRLRNFISAESGANDGLAYLLVFMSIYLVEFTAGTAVPKWLFKTILWQVLGATAFGVVAGYCTGILLRIAERKHFVETQNFLIYTVAVSIMSLSGARLLDLDGIFAVFVTGMTFGFIVNSSVRVKSDKVQEAINTLFTLPIFFLLGVYLPWEIWFNIGYKGVIAAILILFLRRPPFFLFLFPFMKPLEKKRDIMFDGWFGPIGVSALFYAVEIIDKHTTGYQVNTLWGICTLTIAISILFHGVSATPFTTWYGITRRNDTQK
jgi:NhaP-type Na+/H+ or K+/H+ antiporter